MRRINKYDLAFLLILVIWCAVAAHRGHLSIGFGNYVKSAYDVMNTGDPYPAADALRDNAPKDVAWRLFFYGPVFTVLFRLFTPAVLGDYGGKLAFLLMNLCVFWAGFKALIAVMEREKPVLTGWWYGLAMLAMLNESLGMLNVLQINMFMMGSCMLAVALYFEKRYAWAALLLALGVHIKIMPIVFALLLFLEFNAVFIGFFILFIAALALLPALYVPAEFTFQMFVRWLELMRQHSDGTVRPWQYGLRDYLYFLGLPLSNMAFKLFTLANAGAIAAAAWLTFHKRREAFISLVFPLAAGFLVVFNTRLELYGLVMIVPLFAFVLRSALAERDISGRMPRLPMAVFIAAWLMISLFYSDLFPSFWRKGADGMMLRSVGIILLYVWAWGNAATGLKRLYFPAESRNLHNTGTLV